MELINTNRKWVTKLCEFRRVKAQVGVVSEYFVDGGIERDDTPDKVAPKHAFPCSPSLAPAKTASSDDPVVPHGVAPVLAVWRHKV
jgi:hypothetical protein